MYKFNDKTNDYFPPTKGVRYVSIVDSHDIGHKRTHMFRDIIYKLVLQSIEVMLKTFIRKNTN